MQLAVSYTRYLVGGAFVFASLIETKGHRSTQLEGTAAGHNPAYFFKMMYQSGLYWHFIGTAQCGAGLLLAWDWNRLRVVVNLPAVPETISPLFESRLWEAVGAVLFVYTAGYLGADGQVQPAALAGHLRAGGRRGAAGGMGGGTAKRGWFRGKNLSGQKRRGARPDG